MDTGADDAATFGERAQCERDECADRSENDRGVKLLRRLLVRRTGPDGAQVSRERLSLFVAWPRECEDTAPFVPSDLRHDVRGGAESVESQPLALP